MSCMRVSLYSVFYLIYYFYSLLDDENFESWDMGYNCSILMLYIPVMELEGMKKTNTCL